MCDNIREEKCHPITSCTSNFDFDTLLFNIILLEEQKSVHVTLLLVNFQTHLGDLFLNTLMYISSGSLYEKEWSRYI